MADRYGMSVTSSDTSLATPTINKFLLLGKGMLVFILDEEVFEYYKENLADKVSSMYIFPMQDGEDLAVFCRTLEELIKYTIFDNQGAVDSIMVSTQHEDLIPIIKDIVKRTRTYITDLYKYYPEEDKFLISQNINGGTFVYQIDENNYVYMDAKTSKSHEHIPFIVGADIPEIDTTIDAVEYDWSYLLVKEETGGGDSGGDEGGGDEGGGGEEKEPIIPLVELPDEINEETLAECFKKYLKYGWFFELPLVDMPVQMIKVPYTNEIGDTYYTYFYCGDYWGGWTPPPPEESSGGDEGGEGGGEQQLPPIYLISTSVTHKFNLKQTYTMTPTGGLSGMFFDLSIGIGKKYASAAASYKLYSYNKTIMEAGESEDDNYPS